jgi:hypothetical protein
MAAGRAMDPQRLSGGFSPLYYSGIREGAAHHAASKTYSGSLLRPHKPFLTGMIRRLGVQSILDYGCGKGLQYEWIDPSDGKTLEEAWAVPVAKYDPCWPPFAQEPEGQFDLVICTHTLALIPLQDLDRVIARLFGLAAKAVFIAEKIGERKKAEVADPDARAIGWQRRDWLDRIGSLADEYPQIEATVSTRERIGGATIMTRSRRVRGGWVEVPPDLA